MITRATLSTIEQGLPKYRSMLAGNTAYSPGIFDSIATVSVGAGGASFVEFTSIPSTYKHLQIRGISCGTRADYRIGEAAVQFNSDTGSNYLWHDMYGDGSGINASTSSSATTNMRVAPGTLGGNAGGTAFFGSLIYDIIDYANTNKYKTIRSLSGVDLNGTYGGIGGRCGIASGVWLNTNAVSSIKITASGAAPFVQYTRFALYGIKAA